MNTLVNKLRDHLAHSERSYSNSLKAGQLLNKPIHCYPSMRNKEYFSPQTSITFQKPYSIILKGVSSISLHHCTLMMNFCKICLKQDMQVVLKVGICTSLSHIQKNLLYRSEVRKYTVSIFHQTPYTYTEGSFTRAPPRK